MRHSIPAFLLISLFASTLLGQAERRCAWVGSPSSTTSYTPWVVTSVGTFWDTKERTCCLTEMGAAVWYTVLRSRSCSTTLGAGVSITGPSVSTGGTYGWSESFVNVVNSPNATGTLKTKQTSCLFSSETVLNQTV
ncbi:MAG: hypothetical protein V3W41_18840, partial [Planctomycetota bacterium]